MHYENLDCHIYAQESCHDDSYLIASRESLLKIRDAIDSALRSGQGACELFVGDGEGFILRVGCTEGVLVNAFPYMDEIFRGNGRKKPDEFPWDWEAPT